MVVILITGVCGWLGQFTYESLRDRGIEEVYGSYSTKVPAFIEGK